MLKQIYNDITEEVEYWDDERLIYSIPYKDFKDCYYD